MAVISFVSPATVTLPTDPVVIDMAFEGAHGCVGAPGNGSFDAQLTTRELADTEARPFAPGAHFAEHVLELLTDHHPVCRPVEIPVPTARGVGRNPPQEDLRFADPLARVRLPLTHAEFVGDHSGSRRQP